MPRAGCLRAVMPETVAPQASKVNIIQTKALSSSVHRCVDAGLRLRLGPDRDGVSSWRGEPGFLRAIGRQCRKSAICATDTERTEGCATVTAKGLTPNKGGSRLWASLLESVRHCLRPTSARDTCREPVQEAP